MSPIFSPISPFFFSSESYTSLSLSIDFLFHCRFDQSVHLVLAISTSSHGPSSSYPLTTVSSREHAHPFAFRAAGNRSALAGPVPLVRTVRTRRNNSRFHKSERELAKRSRILQTSCHRKTDVTSIRCRWGPIVQFRRVREYDSFVRCRHRDARHSRIDVPDDVPSDRNGNIRTMCWHPLPSQRSTSTWKRANTPNPPPKFRRQDQNPQNGSPHELLGWRG